MKEGWKYRKLEEVCDILDSKRKPITKKNRIAGDIPYYGATGVLDYVKDFIFDEKLVLLGEDGAKWGAGESSAYIIDGKSWVNNHAHALRPRRNLIIDEYLQFFLNYSDLSDSITGVTVPKLNQERMRAIRIPVPSLSEQQRIVELLDAEFAKIDAIKANAEQQLRAAKDLFQAALKEMLTPNDEWEEKKIGDACEIIGGSTPNTKDPSNWDGDYYWVTPAELTGSKYYGVTKRTITQKGAAGLRLLPIGTVLLSSRAPIGKVAITTVPMYCNQGFKNIICPNGIYNEYVYWYILYSVPQLEELGEGTTFKELSKGRLSKFILPIPLLPEQQRIAERLDAISEKVKALQSNYNQTLTLCNDLKQALLKSIFA